jgi:hypothetical protein
LGPRKLIPYTLNELPNLEKFRKDNELERETKSNTLIELPKRLIPNTLIDEPMRQNPRSEKEDPKLVKSKQLIAEPSLDIP